MATHMTRTRRGRGARIVGSESVVIDARTHRTVMRTVMRTATLYTSKELARVAARQMWRERQEVAA